MAKKVTANGKTFTFDDNVTNEQIGSVVDEYFSSLKKKPSEQGLQNTSTNGQPTLNNAGLTDLNSLASGGKQPIDAEIPSVLTEQGQKPYIQGQIAKKDKALQLSQDLYKYQDAYEKAKGTPLSEAVKNIPVYESSVKQGEKEPSFISKAIDGAGYIASGLTKGVQNIAKGASYGTQNITGINPEVLKTGIDQISEPLLPSKQTEARYNDTKIVSQLHGLAEFIPASLAAEATGGATFFLNGVGSGISEVDKMKKEGVKFENGSDDAYIVGRGLIDWALMTRLNSHTIFSKLPSGIRDNVIKKLSMEAIGDIAKQGEKATGESILNTFKEKAVGFDTKIKELGINYLKSYAHTAVDLTALNGANFALGKAVNAMDGKDVFRQTEEDLLNSTKNILTIEAPIFAGFGGAKEVLSGQLFKKSPYRNEVITSLYKDATPENVDAIKSDLTTHLQEKGLNEQEIANSVNYVDKLSEVTRTLPKTLSKAKFNEGVDLIIGRQELKDQLSQIKESKQSLDESIRDIPTKEEELVQAKLEQSNDKLQELATGDKYKYSEDAEKGIYTKQLGNGKPQEISKDRYELEQIEKQFKNQSNEKTNEQNVEDGKLQSRQEDGFQNETERGKQERENDGFQNDVQKEVDSIRSKAKEDIDSILNDETLSDEEIDSKIAEITKQAKFDIKVARDSKVLDKPSVKMESPELTIEMNNPFNKQLQKLGYSEEQISTLTMEQKQSIVTNKTEAPVVESSAKVDSVKENARAEKIAEAQRKLDEEIKAEEQNNNEPNISSEKPADVSKDEQHQKDLEINYYKYKIEGLKEQLEQNKIRTENGEVSNKTDKSINDEIAKLESELKFKQSKEDLPTQEVKTNEQGTTVKEAKVEAQPIEKPTEGEKVSGTEDTKVVEPVKKAGDDLRKVADIIRQGKINKLGGFKASTGFDAVWDSSLEVVAKSIEGGAVIADAIQSGLQHIKESDWYKNLGDKEDFDKKYRDHLQNELNDNANIVEAKNSNDFNEFAQPTERPKVSGIKKGLLSDEIISSVNIDKVSDKEMLEKGKELIDTGEVKPLDIISEIAGVSKESRSASESVVDFVIGREGGSPRALQPKEVVALIWYKTDLDNRYYEALKEHNELTEKGESTASLDKKLADIRQEIEAYQITSLITASQQSLAFRLRQGLLDSNFNLASFVEDYKATNKGYISPEKLAEFQKMSAELDAVKAELKDLQAKDAERIDKEAFDNIVEDVKSKETKNKKSLSDKEFQRKKELQKKFTVANDIGKILANLADKDFYEYVGLVLKEAKGDFKEFGNKVIKELGESYRDYIPDIFKKVGGKGDYTVFDLVSKPKILEDGSLSIPNEYIRELVRNGVTDINDLTAKVKEIVSKDLPSITDRQVRDAITGYGKELGQTKDEIVKQINTAKRIGKLYSKLEDLSNKKKNVKTGKEKSEITEEEIKIRKEIRTLEKGLPKTEQEISMDVEAYEKALETRKKALQEKIDNNQIQLDNEPKSSLFSPKISKLKKEIEADKKEIERLQDESGITDEKRNKLRIQQLTRYEQEKLRQIKEKDFSIKKPKQYVRSKETIKKEQEAWLIRDAFEAAKYKNELDNRSKTKKTVDLTLDTILGLQRALTLGADMGTTLLQGGILNLSQNPIKSFKDLYSNMKSAKSEKTEAEFYAELKTDDNYYKAKIAKLGLQEPSLKQSAKDAEIQGGNLINGAFEAGASTLASPLYFAGKKKAFNLVKELAREYNPYALGERFYAPSVNRLRMTLFNDMVYALEKQGYTIENDLGKFKQAATAVNNLTLRGRLRDLEPIANSLSVAFTAPRKLAATFSLINPYYWGHLLYTNPTVAKVAMLRFGKYLATITAISLVYSAYKSGDDDENKDMLNPYSADFLTWKIGNTRIDMTLGMKQNLVFLSRLLGGKYKSSSSYETKELGDANVPTRLDITGRFAMGKTSPIPHQVLMYMGESKGREVDWGDETQKSITSLWVQNVKELSKEHPREMVALLTTMAILGQGQSTYGGVEFLDQLDPKNKKLISLFNRKEMSVYTPTRPNVKVSDKEDGKIRGLDTKEYELFKKGYDSYFKKEVESRYNELNKMTLDKFESTIKNIKKKAKEEGIVSIGLYDPKEFEIEYNDKKYNDDKQVRTIYNYIDEYKKSDDYKSIKEQLTVANKNLKASGNKGFNVDAKIQEIAIDVAKKKFMLENVDKETGKLKLTEKE